MALKSKPTTQPIAFARTTSYRRQPADFKCTAGHQFAVQTWTPPGVIGCPIPGCKTKVTIK